MTDYHDLLLTTLTEIKGTGSFSSSGIKPFTFPGLEVQGVGEIGFPVNVLEVQEMIKVAHKAPFGKGAETVLDENVRSAWEINPDRFSLNNSDWSAFLNQVIEQIKPDLGLEGYTISANIYKLLIYEEGDFFLAHRDSEKEKGMFGTLIIGLPSRHTGGELHVRFDGKTETIDFSEPAGKYQIPYAAFYADCEHEITPVTSGYRVCLVYNLVQQTDKDKIKPYEVSTYVKKVRSILLGMERAEDEKFPKIILLGHQYTPSGFSRETLKLNDRVKAEVLIQAAQQAGYYSKMALLTSYQAGCLEYDFGRSGSRRGGYYNDYDVSNRDLEKHGTMGELFDSSLELEHWLEDGIPSLGKINIDEDELISSIALNEGEPILKEAEGYTGNAGMEMYYWYHYGAIVLWPQSCQFDVLFNLSTSDKLAWISYYSIHWESIKIAEKRVVKRLLDGGLQALPSSYYKSEDFSPLADLLISFNDEKYIKEKGKDILMPHFDKITLDSWLMLFDAYGADCFDAVFNTLIKFGDVRLLSHALTILNNLLKTDKQRSFLLNHMEQIPVALQRSELSEKSNASIAKIILGDVLNLSQLEDDGSVWNKAVAEALTKDLKRDYVNNVLVETLLVWKERTVLGGLILEECKLYLQKSADNKPQPPADWSRPVPNSPSYKKVWAILADFLSSPTQQVFDYARVQSDRSEMESALLNVTIDLKKETIKKGSPHTLRLTKTQDAYQRDLKKWEVDVALLGRLEDYLKK